MKKILIQIFFILLASPVFANVQKAEALKTLLNAEPKAADNARLALEQQYAEDELLVALKNVKNKKLRDGVVYSLGNLKSESAYPQISKLAYSEKDDCPAAVLALAQFTSKQSECDLKKLVQEGCITAKTALFMRSAPKGKSFNLAETAKSFSEADENTRVKILKNLPADKNVKAFLFSLNPDGERTICARAFALARIGGTDCARQILEDAKKCPNSNLENALAECGQAEETIIAGIRTRDRTAIRAAKIRACKEAEDALIKVAATDGADKKEIFDALEIVASQKTFDFFVPQFTKIKKQDLPAFVKILTSAFTRLDDNSKEKTLNALNKTSEECEGIYKSAAQKILSAAK